MKEGSSQQNDIIIVNICTSNSDVPKYIMKILIDIKRENDGKTAAAGDLDTSPTSLNILSRKKTHKETVSLDDILDRGT